MTTSGTLRILIADDHEGFRRELRETLVREPDFDVVAEVSNGLDAVREARMRRPHGLDLVLMDIDMPVMDGIQATLELAATDPSLPVIILTVSSLDGDLFEGVRSGAVGFLNKTLSPATLTRTIRDHRHTGALPMSRAMAARTIAYLRREQRASSTSEPPAAARLTRREREILLRIAAGARDREIADALMVAETTIKTHVRHILHKLGARNRAEAVGRLGANGEV